MVENINTPLEQQQSINENVSEQLHSVKKCNPLQIKDILENQTENTSFKIDERSNNDGEDENCGLQNRLKSISPDSIKSNANIDSDENEPVEFNEDANKHHLSARAFRYLRNVCHLDDTEFWMKTELTADYQGSTLLSVSNECYGSASNIIKTTIKKDITKQWKENEEDGAQDGWLVKRHEEESYAIIQLGANGKVYGVDVDTTGYTQCAPLSASLYGRVHQRPGSWTKILPTIELKANSHNFFETKNNSDVYDQILITLAPGGGIHRLRVFGDVIPPALPFDTIINLSSTRLGSQIVQKPENVLRKDIPNLILGRTESSQDGWICPRNYLENKPQYTVIKLALEGIIDRIIIDTTHFIGNAPKSVLLQGCSIIGNEETTNQNSFNDANWINLIDSQDPTHQNIYPNMLQALPCVYRKPITHVRIRPIPDGGIQQILFKGRIQQKDKNDNSLLCEESSNKMLKRKRGLDQDNSNIRTRTTRASERLNSVSSSSTSLQT